MKISSFVKVLLLAAAIFTINPLQAQDDSEELSLDGGTLDSQMRYLIEKSNNYQQYEVIPKEWMVKMRKNLSDSLTEIQSELSSLNNQISSQQETIDNLEMELSNTRSELEETSAAKDNMNFVGTVPMQKPLYRVVMWSIIGGLLVLLIIFILRFNRNNRSTKGLRSRLSEIQEEMDQQKKRSLEREQKLSRELQDERNKSRK